MWENANFGTDFNRTLTTDAPVANFFPSFFDASLNLTPKQYKKGH